MKKSPRGPSADDRIAPQLTLRTASFERVVSLVASPRAPTEAMRTLMGLKSNRA
jgi:hypothetical protein